MAFPKLLSKLFTNSGAGSKLNPGLASSLPIGAITAFSGNFDSAGHPISSGAADTSWRLCDGGDGTPDLRGRFVLGVSDGHSAGQTGGEATHTLSEAELPKISGTVNSFPVGGYPPAVSGVFSRTMDGDAMEANSTHEDFSGMELTFSAGGGQPHNNMPPYYALSFIMKIA